MVQNSLSRRTRLSRFLPQLRTFLLLHQWTCQPSQWMLFSCYLHSCLRLPWHSTWVRSFSREWSIAKQHRPRWSGLILATLNLVLFGCSSKHLSPNQGIQPPPRSLSPLLMGSLHLPLHYFTPSLRSSGRCSHSLFHLPPLYIHCPPVSNCVVLLVFHLPPISFFSPFT